MPGSVVSTSFEIQRYRREVSDSLGHHGDRCGSGRCTLGWTDSLYSTEHPASTVATVEVERSEEGIYY